MNKEWLSILFLTVALTAMMLTTHVTSTYVVDEAMFWGNEAHYMVMCGAKRTTILIDEASTIPHSQLIAQAIADCD